MSKIEQLIEQLCPEGVEYKRLGEVCVALKKNTLPKGRLLDEGKYVVINSGRDIYGHFDEYNNEGNAFTVAARGEYAGFTNYFSERFYAGGLCYPYRTNNERECLTKYAYYWLKHKETSIMETLVSRGSIPALNKSDLDNFLIPLPPLPVQQEIVRILDAFTELEAELEARKKQYEYYRDRLLTFSRK